MFCKRMALRLQCEFDVRVVQDYIFSVKIVSYKIERHKNVKHCTNFFVSYFLFLNQFIKYYDHHLKFNLRNRLHFCRSCSLILNFNLNLDKIYEAHHKLLNLHPQSLVEAEIPATYFSSKEQDFNASNLVKILSSAPNSSLTPGGILQNFTPSFLAASFQNQIDIRAHDLSKLAPTHLDTNAASSSTELIDSIPRSDCIPLSQFEDIQSLLSYLKLENNISKRYAFRMYV